jgi:hypothetical protein
MGILLWQGAGRYAVAHNRRWRFAGASGEAGRIARENEKDLSGSMEDETSLIS